MHDDEDIPKPQRVQVVEFSRPHHHYLTTLAVLGAAMPAMLMDPFKDVSRKFPVLAELEENLLMKKNKHSKRPKKNKKYGKNKK